MHSDHKERVQSTIRSDVHGQGNFLGQKLVFLDQIALPVSKFWQKAAGDLISI